MESTALKAPKWSLGQTSAVRCFDAFFYTLLLFFQLGLLFFLPYFFVTPEGPSAQELKATGHRFIELIEPLV